MSLLFLFALASTLHAAPPVIKAAAEIASKPRWNPAPSTGQPTKRLGTLDTLELHLDNGGFEQGSDSFKNDDLINYESMDLHVQEALDMVEDTGGLVDGSMHDGSGKPVSNGTAGSLAKDEAINAQISRDKLKSGKSKDPIVHAEFRRKRNERARELRKERKKDPVAYAEFRRKDRDRVRASMAEKYADPIIHAEAKQKTNARRNERMKDPVARADYKRKRSKMWAKIRKDPVAYAAIKIKDRDKDRLRRAERKNDPVAWAKYRQRRNEMARRARARKKIAKEEMKEQLLKSGIVGMASKEEGTWAQCLNHHYKRQNQQTTYSSYPWTRLSSIPLRVMPSR